MKKIILSMLLAVIGNYAHANVTLTTSELKELSRNLFTDCENLEYEPIKFIHEQLNKKGEYFETYELNSIFTSNYIQFIKDKKCATSATDFIISGAQVVHKYSRKNIKTLKVSKDFFLKDIDLSAGEANLYKFMWELDPKYFIKANEFFNLYIEENKLTKNEIEQCTSNCQQYLKYPNSSDYFNPNTYYLTSMSYNDLFRAFLFKYLPNIESNDKYFEILNNIFERTNQLEIEYIKETGLGSFGNEVATLENFDHILNSTDPQIISFYLDYLDTYLQNRIEKNLLNNEMNKKIYLFFNNESNYKNLKIEYLGTKNLKNERISSYKLGNHIYKFNEEDKKLTLTME